MTLLTIAGLSPVKLAVMGGLWIVFMVLFFIMRKKSKEEEKKSTEGQNQPSQATQAVATPAPGSVNTGVTTASQVAPSIPYVPPMVMIVNLESRPLLKQGEEVPKGNYLEVTPDLDSTNRLLKLANELLPKPLSPNNNFVAVNDSEAKLLAVEGQDFKELLKLTPGTRVEPGYFIEVDLKNKSTDYIIRTDRRLPPTQAKGYRWVRIQTRKLRK